MIWLFVILLALAAFGVMLVAFKLPAGGREAVAAALLLGIAGYALQGHPDEPSAPKAGREADGMDGTAVVGARLALRDSSIPPTDRWIVVADGLARNGQFSDAAETLRIALRTDPKNAEAWVAMGNALIAHAQGQPTPAALYAYRQAMAADPKNSAAPFFLGMTLAQTGDYRQARDLLAGMLKNAPDDAPWRGLVTERIAQLDRLLAGAAQ
ncbi:tetratricopeptide repeat protein [Novosphingobium colocasiae]|uniref:Tetratricopeptide repeat protein n=1 Tax=Novosphingobium colocasiae TaxID=1256513 RepID=A0A918UD99_9SPHN|nr:tetratricopeptide repeat protein [Novosphingobium colocasiae]GGY95434.1 hypothetical protein GCM10011614_07670 [Novosphingobium colocasiae]